jgi:hypothetical protein
MTNSKQVLFMLSYCFSFVQANRDGSPANGERRTPLLDRTHREAANELAGHEDARHFFWDLRAERTKKRRAKPRRVSEAGVESFSSSGHPSAALLDPKN